MHLKNLSRLALATVLMGILAVPSFANTRYHHRRHHHRHHHHKTVHH